MTDCKSTQAQSFSLLGSMTGAKLSGDIVYLLRVHEVVSLRKGRISTNKGGVELINNPSLDGTGPSLEED